MNNIITAQDLVILRQAGKHAIRNQSQKHNITAQIKPKTMPVHYIVHMAVAFVCKAICIVHIVLLRPSVNAGELQANWTADMRIPPTCNMHFR